MGFKGSRWLSVLALGLSGCSLAGGAPRPDPVSPPGRTARSSPSGTEVVGRPPGESPDRAMEPGGMEATANAVVETAFHAIGTPYEWGGTDANGFDCSGLIRYAYGRNGIQLPRISSDQLRMGGAVEPNMNVLRPGDVLGFAALPGGDATHVGLYVGDGRFIHSSSTGVRVSSLMEPYWQRHFVAARRLIE